MNRQNTETEILNYFNRLPRHKQDLMLSLAKNMISENEDVSSNVIQENIDELDARWLEFKSGKSNPQTWSSVKKKLVKKTGEK